VVATTDGLDRFRDVAVATLSVKQGLSNSSVSSVLAAKDGSVWMGTAGGLNRWSNNHVTVYRERSTRAAQEARPRISPDAVEISGSGVPVTGCRRSFKIVADESGSRRAAVSATLTTIGLFRSAGFPEG
jgi:hypothetical protein